MAIEDACEMCGSYSELKPIIIDGAELLVCRSCQRYGKPVTPPPTQKPKPSTLGFAISKPSPTKKVIYRPVPSKKPKRTITRRTPDESLTIDPEYSNIIMQARMKRGWSRQQLARKINERESVLARIETGKLVPSDDIARKLEHELGIKLLIPEEEIEETVSQRALDQEKKHFSQTTLGAIMKIKKKKKK